jgi:hypothetical protein
MAKTSVPRKPRPPRGSGFPVAHPPKGLTLADVTVVRRVLNQELNRITGPELAKLIDATKPEGQRPGLVDTGTIWEELDCLADIVQVLGAAQRADVDAGVTLDKPLYWIGECLKKLGGRVMALDPSGNSGPNWYAVEVKK